MWTLRDDLRYAFRTLRKNPAFAAAVILILALGIGASTAIFAVVNAVLLRPLPYADPDRLVVALHNGSAPVSPADYFDYKGSARAFEGMAAAQAWGANLNAGDRPEHISGIKVSAGMIPLLGVQPLLGRSFMAEEEHGGRAHVLLLSYGLWQRRFGADRSIVGRQVGLDGEPYVVVGVMPPGFRFAPFWATRAEMWAPLDLDQRLNDRDGRSLRVFARLKAGVTVAQAQAQMDGIARHLAGLYPRTNAQLGITVVPLKEKVIGSVRPTLLVLLGTVAFVLLIGCANVANLALTRALARRREMAIRAALGAGRGQLARTALVEMLLLGGAGALLGVLLADRAVELLSALLPLASLPRLNEITVDRTTLVFTALLAALSALLSGVVPALQSARADLNDALKEGGGRAAGDGPLSHRTRFLLIAGEIALSLVLLTGAGLMMRTMVALQAVDAGFNPHHVLTMQVALSGTGYDHDGRRAGLFRAVHNALASIPEVESASAINHLPIGGDIWRLEYTIDGRRNLAAAYRVAMPGYFGTMRIRVIQGRDFNDHDNQAAPLVAIINEAMARRRWPGESPLGKTVHFGVTAADRAEGRTIIGIAANARQSDWTSAPDDEIYVPYYQRPDSFGLSYLTFVLRTRTDPARAVATALQAVDSVDRNVTVSDVISMERVAADQLWRPRLAASLLGVFASIALTLAAMGIYGLISYSMRRRMKELAIRMALGAGPADVVFLALREGMAPVAAGMVAGMAAALALVRFMTTLLYGVTAADPLTFGTVTIVLLFVAAVANLVPALQAACRGSGTTAAPQLR